jgi:hypothetical protein
MSSTETVSFMPVAFTVAICLAAFIVVFFGEIQAKISNILHMKGMMLLLPILFFSYLTVFHVKILGVIIWVVKIILDQLMDYTYQLLSFNIILQYLGMTILFSAFMQLGLYVLVYIFEDLLYSDQINIYPYQILNATFWALIYLV